MTQNMHWKNNSTSKPANKHKKEVDRLLNFYNSCFSLNKKQYVERGYFAGQLHKLIA